MTAMTMPPWPAQPPLPPRPTMRQRIAARPLWHKLTAAAVAAAVVAGAALLIVDATTDTQDEIAERCLPALRARTAGDTSKPEACRGLSEENYTLLIMSLAVEDTGLDDQYLDEGLLEDFDQ